MPLNKKIFRLPVVLGSALLVLFLPQSAVAAAVDESPQTLQQQLDATREGFAKRAPPEVIQNIDAAVKDVADTGILERALKTGDRAPDFILPDATGANVRLSTLLENGPVILAWYRGNW